MALSSHRSLLVVGPAALWALHCARSPPEVNQPPAACAALSRTACMHSTSCTLEHAPRPLRRDLYLCRPEQSPCETGIAQSALIGQNGGDASEGPRCLQRTGCKLDPGGSYCPCSGAGQSAVPDGPEAPLCNCVAGGGPPANCVQDRTP